jgi:DNA-binding NtrC family response regulator
MLAHSWPGNLRELRNVLERAAVLSADDLLDPAPAPGADGAVPRSLQALEIEAIRRALAYTRGRQAKAADLLGISRKALWEKRKRYSLP